MKEIAANMIKMIFSNYNFFLTGNSLNNEGSVIECGDKLLESTKCFRDVDFHLHDQVNAVALEQRVLLLVQDNDNVTWLKSRLLISRDNQI
jgi:hypothetical protein